MSGGGGGTNTSTIRTVPPWAVPYVQAYAETAYNLWQAGTLSAYSGSTSAAQNQDEVDGIDGLANRGRYGDQVITKAIAYEDDVINGGFLPGTKAAFLAALGYVTGNSTTSFASVNSRVGRKPYFVSDPDSTLLAQTLAAAAPATYNARASAMIYADNYKRERVIQDHGLAYGVEMGKHAAIDAEALRRAGVYTREYTQGTYELAHKIFVEQQELAVANLEIFGNAIRALTGSSQSTTEQREGGNKMMGAVGGAMGGAIFGFMVGGPIGAIGGAVIGGVIGWFS